MTRRFDYQPAALRLHEAGTHALVHLEIHNDKGTRAYKTALPLDLAKELDETYDRLIREAAHRLAEGQ